MGLIDFRAVGVPQYVIGAKHTKYRFALVEHVHVRAGFGYVALVWFPDENKEMEVPLADLRKWGFKHSKKRK